MLDHHWQGRHRRLAGFLPADPSRGDDIEAARAELCGRGVEVSDIRHMAPDGWKPGTDPQHSDYNSFADFRDPDGNTWVLQEVRRAR